MKAPAGTSVGQRIREAREAAQLTQQDLAKHLARSRACVSQWEGDVTSPTLASLSDLAKLLPNDITPEWLAYGVSNAPIVIERSPPGTVSIKEVIFGNKVDERSDAGAWSIPESYLKGDLHVMSTEGLIVWRAESDALAPLYEYGDRIIVDTNAKRVSPPGVFLIWDGVGPSLAQIAVTQVDGKTSVARVSTSTKPNESYEVPIDQLQIIGRARGRVHAN
jgi:transcriptional regulator with XRE-family HTH domain